MRPATFRGAMALSILIFVVVGARLDTQEVPRGGVKGFVVVMEIEEVMTHPRGRSHSVVTEHFYLLEDRLRRERYRRHLDGGEPEKPLKADVMIIDTKVGVVIFVDDEGGTYRRRQFAELEQEMRAYRDGPAAQMQFDPPPTLVALDKTEIHGENECQWYKADLDVGEQLHCLSDNPNLIEAWKLMGNQDHVPTTALVNLQFPSRASFPGFPIRSVFNLSFHPTMRVRGKSRLVSIEQRTLDEDLFLPPSGYQRQL